MDAQLKTKWVEALRSGKYAQGKGSLRHQDQFCCLGVLCDVLGTNWETRRLNSERVERDDESYLRAPILNLVGFDHQTQKRLAHMNDSLAPFPEIADYIEKNL